MLGKFQRRSRNARIRQFRSRMNPLGSRPTALGGLVIACAALALVARASIGSSGIEGLPNDRLAVVRAGHLSGASPPPIPDPRTLAYLRAEAQRQAARNGEPRPTGSVFSTTRQFANAAIGAGVVDSDQPVYLIVLRGNFTGHAARRPNGDVPLPRGEHLAVVIDPETRQITDWGILFRKPETATFGPAVPLDG